MAWIKNARVFPLLVLAEAKIVFTETKDGIVSCWRKRFIQRKMRNIAETIFYYPLIQKISLFLILEDSIFFASGLILFSHIRMYLIQDFQVMINPWNFVGYDLYSFYLGFYYEIKMAKTIYSKNRQWLWRR
jgi:hypothetical protein